MRLKTIFVALALCALVWAVSGKANTASEPIVITVAADGSGQFKSIQEAIMSVPSGHRDKHVIVKIKPGVYKELLFVMREKCFFHLIGEDPEKTVITYDLYAGMTGPDNKIIGTFRTPTAFIDADDFTIENITFENTAGTHPKDGQALAASVHGDRIVFRNCRFLGWQDTIFIDRGRTYFENCYITGLVDFIFGGATAFFEKCHIHARGNGYLTAASTPDGQPFGFVFNHCKITGESPEVKTYLGRPWRAFSSTIFLNTEMSNVVRPEGWNNWNLPEREKTSRYAEFNSSGPGASAKTRAPWSRQLTPAEANAITVEKVLGGSDKWDPRKQ